MAATNTPAAQNPFRRMFMRGATGGLNTPTTTDKSNPSSALTATGDPSLNQSFSGPGAGFAQFGQQIAQQRAGKVQAAQMSGALGELQQRLQQARDQGVNPAQAFLGMLRDDPSAFMALHKSGILGDATALQQFVYGQQQAAQNAANAGKVTMVGPHTGYVTDPKGGIHVLQLGQDEQYDANSGMIISKSGATARPVMGPDGTPIQGKNQQSKYKVTVNPDGSTKVETTGTGTPPAEAKPASNTSGDVFMQPHNMDDKQRAYMSNVTNLYGALKDLQTVGDQVMDPIQGKLKSFFGGQLFGTNDSAVMWNAAMARAENAIAKMPAGAGMGQTAIKEILGNLPKTWNSEYQGKVNLQGQIDNLQKEAQTMVNLSEVPQAGKNYPVAIDKGTANDLATMGVLSNRYRPGHGGDPKALGDEALQELVNHYSNLQPDDQAAVKMEIQRRMQASAQQATTNLGTNQQNQGVNPNSATQKPVQAPNPGQVQPPQPGVSPQQPPGPGATGPLLTPQAPQIPAPYGQQ